jgi:NAD(P)-dependent dehydrogenase (short-subunit alcohol dehydrogenase family)
VSWNVADIPDQTGRTAVVTGANGGLGLAEAEADIRRGGSGRSPSGRPGEARLDGRLARGGRGLTEWAVLGSNQ